LKRCVHIISLYTVFMPKSNTKSGHIYIDYAASASPNPSSIHTEGVFAKRTLEDARRIVASLLAAHPDEIIFTSGATESNNLAIQGVINYLTPTLSLTRRGRREKWILPHIITTNIEHPSVLETCRMLEERKLTEVTIVPVERSGIIDPEKIKKAIKKNTVLVSVMYANNEIGTIQPIREIAKVIRHYKKSKSGKDTLPLLHVDAVQAANYLDLNVERLGVDLLSLTGSKVEGAGRIGVLYKKRNVTLAPLFGGGDQERGLRPGTENVLGVAEFANACALARTNFEREAKRLTELRDYFLEKLQKVSRGVLDITINGNLKERLPNNLNITFGKIPSDLIVLELSARGVMASSKSACKSSSSEGSYVLKAINPDFDPEVGGVRFSFGRDTKKTDIDYTISTLQKIVAKHKKWYT